MKTEKTTEKLLLFGQQTGTSHTIADIVYAYKTHIAEYGKEAADQTLKRTLDSFKDRAEHEQKILFSKVRQECLEKYGSAPAARTVFEKEYKLRPERFDTPACLEYKKRFL